MFIFVYVYLCVYKGICVYTHTYFTRELNLCILYSKYDHLSLVICALCENSGLICYTIHLFVSFAILGVLRSLLQYHSSKAPVIFLVCFFRVQLLLSQGGLVDRQTIQEWPLNHKIEHWRDHFWYCISHNIVYITNISDGNKWKWYNLNHLH